MKNLILIASMFIGIQAIGQVTNYGTNSGSSGTDCAHYGYYAGNSSVSNNYFNSLFGANSGRYLAYSSSVYDAQGNMMAGYQSGYNTETGYFLTLLGSKAGYNGGGDGNEVEDNTFLGALNEGPSYDDGNTGIGAASATTSNIYSSTGVGYNSRPTSSNTIKFGNSSVTSIGGYKAWSNLSDARFKTGIVDSVIGLDYVRSVSAVTYDLKIDMLNDIAGNRLAPELSNVTFQRQVGFLAQQCMEIELKNNLNYSIVNTPENSEDFLSINYSSMTIPLIKAVQELDSKLLILEKNTEEKNQKLINLASKKLLKSKYMLEPTEVEMNIVSLDQFISTSTGYLIIKDLEGNVLEELDLTKSNIQNQGFTPGLYEFVLRSKNNDTSSEYVLVNN